MTTPPTGKAPGPVRDPSAPASDAEERSAQLGRWSQAGALLVIASALGTLLVARFPETIALGVLALGGVAAAVFARRFRDRAPTSRAGAPGSRPAGAARTGPGPTGPGATGPGPAGSRDGRQGGGPSSAGTSDGSTRTRPELTNDQRRERSTIVTIVMGSIIAALHLAPALTWSVSASHQECLDGAVTNQAVDTCENGLDDRLLGWLGTG